MEERRAANEKIISFIAKAEEKLEGIHTDIISLNTKVGIQNGRVYKIEEWKTEIETKIKQRKDNYNTAMAAITVIATIIMAVSAWITIFNRGR
jgi:hypothetical protein